MYLLKIAGKAVAIFNGYVFQICVRYMVLIIRSGPPGVIYEL